MQKREHYKITFIQLTNCNPSFLALNPKPLIYLSEVPVLHLGSGEDASEHVDGLCRKGCMHPQLPYLHQGVPLQVKNLGYAVSASNSKPRYVAIRTM